MEHRYRFRAFVTRIQTMKSSTMVSLGILAGLVLIFYLKETSYRKRVAERAEELEELERLAVQKSGHANIWKGRDPGEAGIRNSDGDGSDSLSSHLDEASDDVTEGPDEKTSTSTEATTTTTSAYDSVAQAETENKNDAEYIEELMNNEIQGKQTETNRSFLHELKRKQTAETDKSLEKTFVDESASITTTTAAVTTCTIDPDETDNEDEDDIKDEDVSVKEAVLPEAKLRERPLLNMMLEQSVLARSNIDTEEDENLDTVDTVVKPKPVFQSNEENNIVRGYDASVNQVLDLPENNNKVNILPNVRSFDSNFKIRDDSNILHNSILLNKLLNTQRNMNPEINSRTSERLIENSIQSDRDALSSLDLGNKNQNVAEVKLTSAGTNRQKDIMEEQSAGGRQNTPLDSDTRDLAKGPTLDIQESVNKPNIQETILSQYLNVRETADKQNQLTLEKSNNLETEGAAVRDFYIESGAVNGPDSAEIADRVIASAEDIINRANANADETQTILKAETGNFANVAEEEISPSTFKEQSTDTEIPTEKLLDSLTEKKQEDIYTKRLRNKLVQTGRLDLLQNANCQKRLPKAIVIGVMKAGTEAFSTFLGTHPQVAMQFSYPAMMFFSSSNYENGLEWYRERMMCSTEDQVTMEKSPQYFSAAVAPKRIYDMDPDIKLIVLVRDPVSRAMSHFLQQQSSNPERVAAPTFDECVYDKVTKTVIRSSPYVLQSTYSIILKRWLKYFSSKQILIIDGDTFRKNPTRSLFKTENFLRIDHSISKERLYFNEEKGFYCLKIQSTDPEDQEKSCFGEEKGRKHPSIDPEVKRALQNYFKPYNEDFMKLTGMKMNW